MQVEDMSNEQLMVEVARRFDSNREIRDGDTLSVGISVQHVDGTYSRWSMQLKKEGS